MRCEGSKKSKAWIEESEIQWRTLATGLQGGSEGTVHGWCGGFAGVLFKRCLVLVYWEKVFACF